MTPLQGMEAWEKLGQETGHGSSRKPASFDGGTLLIPLQATCVLCSYMEATMMDLTAAVARASLAEPRVCKSI